MRIALVSDIHGNLAALAAVAADTRQRGVDQVVNLGDSLPGPLLPRETAQFLIAQGWLSLAGHTHVAHVVETGSPDARHAIVEASATGWTVSLLSVPYDHESVALLAQRRGRPDRAHALRTGYQPA